MAALMGWWLISRTLSQIDVFANGIPPEQICGEHVSTCLTGNIGYVSVRTSL